MRRCSALCLCWPGSRCRTCVRKPRCARPFLDGLLNPDEVRRLLLWMNDPRVYRSGAGPAEWAAFCNLCQHKYGFNPQSDGELAAAERLGQPKGAWEGVWQRFVEAPDAYPNLPDLLRRARPGGPVGAVRESLPLLAAG